MKNNQQYTISALEYYLLLVLNNLLSARLLQKNPKYS